MANPVTASEARANLYRLIDEAIERASRASSQ